MKHSSRITQIFADLRSPPERVDSDGVVLSAFYLTTLLVGCVPVVALTTGIPVLALIVAVALLYGVTLLATDNVFEGLSAAVVVLVTFDANVPIARLPLSGDEYTSVLDIMLVDVIAVPFAGLILWWLYSGKSSFSFSRKKITGYALAGFVIWSFFAVLAGNGPSRLAGLFYVVVQLRSLILFGVAAVIVRYTGIHSVVYSLTIAILGQLAYAVAEVLNQGSFGLTVLGDASGGWVSAFHIGPLQLETSLYAGGFTNSSRMLVALLLLIVPVLVAIVVRRSRPWKLTAMLALVGSVLVIRVSDTDAGWIAFLLTALLAVIALCAHWFTTSTTDRVVQSKTSDYVSGIGATIGSMALCLFLFTYSRNIKQPTGNTSGSSGGASSAGGGSSAEGVSLAEKSPDINNDLIISAINHVPFVDTTSFSVRFYQYFAAVDIALQHPLFGIGGRNFQFVAESYGLPLPMAIHNVYLAVLASAGVPGMMLFLLSIGAVVVIASRMVRSSKTDNLFWAMLVCGMLGFHAYGFWVTVYNGVPYLAFWVFAGAVVGASQQYHRTEKAGRSNMLR